MDGLFEVTYLVGLLVPEPVLATMVPHCLSEQSVRQTPLQMAKSELAHGLGAFPRHMRRSFSETSTPA